MVHRNQRLAGGEGKPLGEAHPHEQRADKPGRGGDGYVVDIGKGHFGVSKRLLHNSDYVFGVTAAGNFRHNAAVKPVLRHLRIDYGGDYFSAVLDDRCRGFIAGGFD